MDAFKGVTFQDYACALGNSTAGMPVEEICRVLGITPDDWIEVIRYWGAKMQELMAQDPSVVTTYSNYMQNPRQGKFANVVESNVRSLDELLLIVPDQDTYQNIAQQFEAAGGNAVEFLKSYGGMSLAEWRTVGGYWISRKPEDDKRKAAAIRRANKGIGEDTLRYLTKAGDGVYIIKNLFGDIVFDQNERTVTGRLADPSLGAAAAALVKVKETVSFDDFHEFTHITTKYNSNMMLGDGITVGTRLVMSFFIGGVENGKLRNLTIDTFPDKEKMDIMCDEILFIMDRPDQARN